MPLISSQFRPFLQGFGILGPNECLRKRDLRCQQGLNKAYNDYYIALKTGPEKSPAEQARLRTQIIGPAEKALNQAMQKDAMAYDPNKIAGASGSSGGGGTTFRETPIRGILGQLSAIKVFPYERYRCPTRSTPTDSAPIEVTAPAGNSVSGTACSA